MKKKKKSLAVEDLRSNVTPRLVSMPSCGCSAEVLHYLGTLADEAG